MAGTMIVSLDFELFWGLLEEMNLEDYRQNVLGGRAAIPRLLELFQQYDIHATWATVGFMFAENAMVLSIGKKVFAGIAEHRLIGEGVRINAKDL